VEAERKANEPLRVAEVELEGTVVEPPPPVDVVPFGRYLIPVEGQVEPDPMGEVGLSFPPAIGPWE